MKILFSISLLIFLYAAFLIFADLSFVLFNLFEAIFWMVIGLCTIMSFRMLAKKYIRFGYILAMTFAVFSLTDVIEIYTGAFWRPWWLLLLNVICVFSIVCFSLFFLVQYYFDRSK